MEYLQLWVFGVSVIYLLATGLVYIEKAMPEKGWVGAVMAFFGASIVALAFCCLAKWIVILYGMLK